MHSPRLEIDDHTLDKSFDRILQLLEDRKLKKHAGKYLETNNYIHSLEKVRRQYFELISKDFVLTAGGINYQMSRTYLARSK